MADLISRIFSTFNEQFLNPIGDNLWLTLEPAWRVCVIVALFTFIFGLLSSKKALTGTGAGALIFLLVVGFVVFQFGEETISTITSLADPAAVESSYSGGATTTTDSGAAVTSADALASV